MVQAPMPSAPMMAGTEDTTSKYASPYVADTLQDNGLKRRRSSENMEGYEKRQKVEPITLANDNLAALLAQATASATQAFSAPVSNGFEAPQTIQEPVVQHVNPAPVSTNGTSDPYLYMRILSLPILESLSVQILSRLAQGPYSETIRIITEPESELGQAYTTLKSLFDQTKKIYTRDEPFLSAEKLNIQETEHRATIRTTNLATFVSSVFGGQDVGFCQLNDHFIETFTPDGERLQKEPGLLYLNFKTQMYLSAVSEEEQDQTKEEILEGLFPDSLEDLLASRHPDIPLSQHEREFMGAIRGRREFLLLEPSNIESIQMLSEKFAWEDFLRRLSHYLSQTYEPLLKPYMQRHSLTAPAFPPQQPDQSHSPNMFAAYTEQTDVKPTRLTPQDIAERAKRAADAALRSVQYSQSFSTTPQQNGSLQHNTFQQPVQNSYHSEYNSATVPFPTQTAPTQVLYEQARQAAAAKATPTRSRPGLPSYQRRPWSQEEENALMAGLDSVKGPHWSQILALYGAKGSISEILKDRNQVQLKDKARNLKLFFLKSGIEVPYFLQSVTGELKTRAPTQAARREAEERARLANGEERARFNGIMTLAGGMQGHASEMLEEEEESSSLNDEIELFDFEVQDHVGGHPNQSMTLTPNLDENQNQNQNQNLNMDMSMGIDMSVSQDQEPAQTQTQLQSQQISDEDRFTQQLMAATAAAQSVSTDIHGA
ncbi:hypothetical protein BP5796_08198 [Coleophoma crateriformis]|uniref:HTH myb-type domain-containing protein n=1 Tax=Coleophoma crateriformis TaxID=565419 RepID=A0A3D8RE78_9HELO|nr:hypothetical protein BP5796_08198 [Coleophoma crateriformis]